MVLQSPLVDRCCLQDHATFADLGTEFTLEVAYTVRNKIVSRWPLPPYPHQQSNSDFPTSTTTMYSAVESLMIYEGQIRGIQDKMYAKQKQCLTPLKTNEFVS
jgi:hypothetical protein